MMYRLVRNARATLRGLLLLLALPHLWAQETEIILRSRVPLGNESFIIESQGRTLYVLASAESPEFEGWRLITDGERRKLVNSAGRPVRHYPQNVVFRVSASTRAELLHGSVPFTLRLDRPAEDYLVGMRFRLKIFQGLQATLLEPESVKLIGMPADVPYDERIFRVSFEMPNTPIYDRVVLEVLSPEGDRVCKFHLDLL